MNPKQMLAAVPEPERGLITFRSRRPSEGRRREGWVVQVQRYRILASWYYRFEPDAEAALELAVAKAREALQILAAYHFPQRSRLTYVTGRSKKRKNGHLPLGIHPDHRRPGGLVVRWLDLSGNHYLQFAPDELAQAVAFRDRIAREAADLDEWRAKKFFELMTQLGASISERRSQSKFTMPHALPSR